MIHAKLLAFQKLNIALEKDGRNPHFNSDYTTLTEVLNKTKVPLNDLGIVVVQLPGYRKETDADLEYGLFTRLIDTEDETFIEGFVPYLEATNAQKLGSNLTYARRYSLIAMLGLGDTDDDGNAASTAPTTVAKKIATPRVPSKDTKGVVERNDEPFSTAKAVPAKDTAADKAPPAQPLELEDISWDDIPFTDEDFNKK